MRIADQIKSIHSFIVYIVETNSTSITNAAAEVLHRFRDKTPTPNLANTDHLLLEFDSTVLEIACEESRMLIADELLVKTSMSCQSILENVSDTSLDAVRALIKYALHEAPNDKEMGAEFQKIHRSFLDLTPIEIIMINHYRAKDLSLNTAWATLNNFTREDIKHIDYYTDKISFTLEQALMQVLHSREFAPDSVNTTTGEKTSEHLEAALRVVTDLTPEKAAEAYFKNNPSITIIDHTPPKNPDDPEPEFEVPDPSPYVGGYLSPPEMVIRSAPAVNSSAVNSTNLSFLSLCNPAIIIFTMLAGLVGFMYLRNRMFTPKPIVVPNEDPANHPDHRKQAIRLA